ncbi:MAG: hypothetical protein JSV94_00215 [Methanobacteriota archaeon]|nr:MAG: hypothetical protein JSV94_00215 [Euryarchaeota archaeon]
MTSAEIFYFDEPGRQNTDTVIDLVSKSLRKTGIGTVIIASSSGETALNAIEHWSNACSNVVVVTSHAGFAGENMLDMKQETEEKIKLTGAKLVRASHVLSGLERSFTRKFHGVSRTEVVSETLRALFGQGMKVCVEISVMASDSGAIRCGDEEIIAVGGTGDGADTACIIRPAHANDFFRFEVREIIAMPRRKRNSGYK